MLTSCFHITFVHDGRKATVPMVDKVWFGEGELLVDGQAELQRQPPNILRYGYPLVTSSDHKRKLLPVEVT